MNAGWKPHPGPQTDFLSRGEFEVLFGGAAGPGKTDCLIVAALRNIHHPRYHALIIRRTFPQLQEIIDRCFHFCPLRDPGADYRSSEHRWYFPSGATLDLGHMQHENDKYNYQGKEFHFCGFDEVTQFTETQYLYLHSRMRTGDADLAPEVRATTNPGGIGHLWCKSRFVDVCAPGTVFVDPDSGQSRVFISALVTDNPTLMENDPAYVSRLKALPEIEKKRLLYGEWDVFEGQVFPELSQRVHGCDPFDIPPEWEKFMSFDWGYSKPFSVGWYAVDFDGVLYRYREWYGCKEGESDVGVRMTPTEIARGIMERERERVAFRVADPACWSKQPTKDKRTGPSVIEDMQKEGLRFVKADNNRMLGKVQVHARLKLEEIVDEQTGEVMREYPRFVVFNDQPEFWRTMMNIYADVKNPEDIDTDQEDHIYDETRYAMMARPVRPKKVSRIPSGTFAAERNRFLKAKKYAQRHGVSLSTAYGRVR